MLLALCILEPPCWCRCGVWLQGASRVQLRDVYGRVRFGAWILMPLEGVAAKFLCNCASVNFAASLHCCCQMPVAVYAFVPPPLQRCPQHLFAIWGLCCLCRRSSTIMQASIFAKFLAAFYTWHGFWSGVSSFGPRLACWCFLYCCLLLVCCCCLFGCCRCLSAACLLLLAR